MSSSLPVPSKAALTALRGLVVGTSCTLALVAEDRRRKINNAVRAIENGEKIKSARKYRAGGGALAVAIEEDAIWDAGLGLASIPRAGLGLHPYDTRDHGGILLDPKRNSKNQRGQLAGQNEGENMAGPSDVGLTNGERGLPSEHSDINNPNSTDSPARPSQPGQLLQTQKPASIPPLPKLTAPPKSGPSWMWENTETVKAYAYPTSDDVVTKVHNACAGKDSRQLAEAVRAVLEAMDHNLAPDNSDQRWLETTALLCRTCQARGHLNNAVKLLGQVIDRGPMAQNAYFSHEPLALIESLVARAELSQPSSKAYVANLDTAINLFLGLFLEKPTELNRPMHTLGRRLLEHCFTSNRLQRIFSIFRRCLTISGGETNDLTTWFITKLYEHQYHASVVKIFLSVFTKSSPTEDSVRAIGDLVVDSVELAHNHMPGGVLSALQAICADFKKTKLSSRWVMKLLLSHWKNHGEFRHTEALFGQLRPPGLTSLRTVVHRPEDVCRVMVELALEAGDVEKADLYFHLANAEVNRDPTSDIRLRGVFARFYATQGDWGSVRIEFAIMGQLEKSSDQVYAQAFVPVLKAYAETHTVREAETFLKSYVDDFGVPLCSYTVTLMAKRYGAIRDVQSLINWLDYCSRAGFPVDAAFTNAILVRCRRQWKFPFRDLRTLFRKLRALNPNFIDKHTEQIMADAALSDSKHGGPAARGRLLSLRVDADKLPDLLHKHAPAEDVALAMKEALTRRLPRNALGIYKRAVFLNTPFSQHTLRLAVQAQLIVTPCNYDAAYQMIRTAQIKSKGADTSPIVNYLLARQLQTVTLTVTSGEEAEAIIQNTLKAYRKAGITLTEASLHRAAVVCLKTGHFRGAIRYALQAAESRGQPPCFNLGNFRILLAAYASLLDIPGLRETIRHSLTHPYREDTTCRSALRQARQRVGHSTATVVTPEQRVLARRVLDEAIGRVVDARKKLREEGKELEGAALGIMKAAAKDMAGGEEVDLEAIPWLGGVRLDGKGRGKKKKGRRGKGRRGKGDDGDVVVDDAFTGLEQMVEEQALLERATAVEASF